MYLALYCSVKTVHCYCSVFFCACCHLANIIRRSMVVKAQLGWQAGCSLFVILLVSKSMECHECGKYLC